MNNKPLFEVGDMLFTGSTWSYVCVGYNSEYYKMVYADEQAGTCYEFNIYGVDCLIRDGKWRHISKKKVEFDRQLGEI